MPAHRNLRNITGRKEEVIKQLTAWEEMYRKLEAYYLQHGHTDVPARSENDKSLAQWVRKQRQQREALNLRQISQLNRLEFVWDPASRQEQKSQHQWEQMYRKLREFAYQHGHADVPARYAKNKPLANWVVRQRASKDKLNAAQIRKLEMLNFTWNPKEATWNEMFNRLIQFQREHGHLNVPVQYDEDPKLGRWVNKQRASTGRMDASKRIRLNQIGFVWKPGDQKWQHRYEALCMFQRQYGHLQLPPTEHYKSLRNWMAQQRFKYRRGRLDPAKYLALQKLGLHLDKDETAAATE